MTSNKSNQTIDVDEVDHHLIYIKSAIESQTEEERKQYLTEALLSYGIRFGYSLNELARMSDQKKYQDLSDEYLDLLVSWLTGKRLTERADEDERRIVLAIESIEGMGEDNSLGRLAASSILKLPLGHPRRDVDMAHQALLNNLGRCSDHGDIEGQVSTITDLVKYKSESKDRTLELIQEGQNLIDQVSDPDIRRNFQIQILGYYIQFAITNRDDGNIQAQKQWTMKAKTIYDQLITENQGNSHYMDKNLYLSALLFEIMEEPAKAAERFASIINSEKHHEGEYHIAAMHEGRLRIVLGEYQRGIEVLEPVVPIFEELYLTAVEDTAVRDAGKDFSKVATNLAFAHACMGQWQEAVRNLEMGKSLRLRYRKALRESHRGQTILELEKKLYALSRGVSQESERTTDRASDWLGEQISLQSRVLEEYRKQRPVLSSKLLISPSISEIATSLVQDEAVVMMGLSFKGTMIAVICPGDENMPSGHFLFEDWTKGKLAGFLTGGEDEDGWLFANGAPELMIDRQQALDKLIDGFEEAIGKPLGSFLKHKGVHRVTIIPHLWTRLVPFWALPSLVDFDILISPSATNFITSRQSVKVLHHKALIVADPTLDLPVSLAEAEASGQYLASMGWDITQLIKENATEEALNNALSDVSFLHFCGHGKSDLIQPERSALLVHPDPNLLPSIGNDPFEPLVSAVKDWQEINENERFTDLSGIGRLSEKRDKYGGIIERWIEHSERGTLWGHYQDNRLKQLAELWTEGDIMVQGSISNCSVAFLSACESGSGAIDPNLDEYSGLPAAFQLAGVFNVISTLWPVSDVMTAIFVELFYRSLAQSSRKVNIASLVHHVGKQLRRMNKEEAGSLLSKLRSRTSDPEARFRLEAFRHNILNGAALPFRHPYEWAAFYMLGSGDIILSGEDVYDKTG